jgi:hypothetical protein
VALLETTAILQLTHLLLLFSLQTRDLAQFRASTTDDQEEQERSSLDKQRLEFVQGLLEQQSEHQRLGFHDPRGLFQFSKACSKTSRQRAQLQAEETARQVHPEIIGSIDQVFGIRLPLLPNPQTKKNLVHFTNILRKIYR